MVKTYLKYILSQISGLTSGEVNPVIDKSKGYFISASNSTLLLYNLRTSKLVELISFENINKYSKITYITLSSEAKLLFIGFESGVILSYKLNKDLDSMIETELKSVISYEAKFSLHKSKITFLQYDHSSNLLLSCSADTFIFIWDILSESILYKLSGHKDSIIKAEFFNLQRDRKSVV